MKKLILAFFLFLSIFSAYSQGGPDLFGYTWRDSNDSLGPQYNWIDITTLPGAVQVTGLADDNTAGFYPIGFQFPYYWYTVSQFIVGSNGYMIFDNGAMASPFPAIPAPTLPHNFIAPFMCDITFSGTGNTAQCFYWSNQVDTLILSYINVPFWINATPPFTGANTFQIILSAVDSSITFQYSLQQGVSPGTGTFLSIGIENNTGNIGLQHSLNTYPAQSFAIKYYYPQSTTFTVDDASTVSNNNPETGALFLPKNGAPFTMNTQVRNEGNQTIGTFDVILEIQNSLGVTQVSETLTTSTSLAPGQTEDLTATSTFTPTFADRYSFNTTTQLVGDATPTNNSKSMELVVIDTTQSFMTLGYTGDFPIPTNAGVSWSGGNAGVGIEIIPPFYPSYLRQLQFYITTNVSLVGFYALVYDNTGPNNGPGTLLDSVNVPAINVLEAQWNVVSLPIAIPINSGSVFIAWMMDGVDINLGTDNNPPISNRTYEILGGWAIYRNREDRDLMIRAIISSSPTTGTGYLASSDNIGEFYPSPSAGKVFINVDNIDASGEINFAFYNVEGRLVENKKIAHINGLHQNYSFDISKYGAGIYLCKITAGNREYNRKLIIIEN